MPWRSRIESESVRRVVLAGIMIAVLGVCTLLTLGVTPQSRLRTGAFRWSVPPMFAVERRGGDAHVELTGAYGRQPRVMHVMMLPNVQPRSPLQARREAMERLTPVAQWVDTRQRRVGDLHVFSWVGKSPVLTGDGRTGTRTQWLTALTPDGRHYLVVYLFTFGEPTPRDFASHERLIESIDLAGAVETTTQTPPKPPGPEQGDDSTQ